MEPAYRLPYFLLPAQQLQQHYSNYSSYRSYSSQQQQHQAIPALLERHAAVGPHMGMSAAHTSCCFARVHGEYR